MGKEILTELIGELISIKDTKLENLELKKQNFELGLELEKAKRTIEVNTKPEHEGFIALPKNIKELLERLIFNYNYVEYYDIIDYSGGDKTILSDYREYYRKSDHGKLKSTNNVPKEYKEVVKLFNLVASTDFVLPMTKEEAEAENNRIYLEWQEKHE